MYHPISAFGVPRGINEHWVGIALTQYTISELFTKFRKVIVTAQLENEAVDTYIDLSQFACSHVDFRGRLSDLFIDIGNKTVVVMEKKPTIDPKSVGWNDAFRCGYNVRMWDKVYRTGVDIEEMNDALLTRENPVTDYREFVDNCIVSVSGLFHYIDTDNTSGVVVYGAGKSLKISGDNQVGILSFKKIGGVKCIPIRDDMIKEREFSNVASKPPFKISGYLTIPGDISKKTVLLVLGGYLITPDMGFFKQVGNNEFVIDWDAYPLLDRYYDSLRSIDLSSLGFTINPINTTQRSLSELTNDAVLKAYLKLSQTFFIVVDTPEIYVETQKLHNIGISGVYRMYSNSNLPLLLSNGRVAEYWRTYYDGVHTLTVNGALCERRVYNRARLSSLPTAINTGLSAQAAKPADAFLLGIGVDYRLV